MVLLLFIGFGYAKPVPVNPFNLKNPKSDMIKVAAAGPISNLVLGFIGTFLFYLLHYLLIMNNNILWDKMISASSIRNYLLKDTLSDWLKYYRVVDVHSINSKKNIFTKTIRKPKNRNNVFLNYIVANLL